jgi:hypothetical protein
MKFYAKLENNVVIAIKTCLDTETVDGDEWQYISYEKQKNPVGLGFTYDNQNDVFIYPKPFDSWVLNNSFSWEAPVSYPDDGYSYDWDEDSISWKLSIQSTL